MVAQISMEKTRTSGTSNGSNCDSRIDLRFGKRAFSDEEFRNRMRAVQTELRNKKADFLLADSYEHLGYITGFMPGGSVYQVAIMPADDDPIIILRELDEPTYSLNQDKQSDISKKIESIENVEILSLIHI